MTGADLALYAVGVCLLIGAGFALVGSVGLLKFNDSMTRMHAPTKVGTLGIGALLLASVIYAEVTDGSAIHAILIMVFLFVTAPISAHFIAKVAIHRRTCTPPPAPTEDTTWATLDVPEQDRPTP
jgi:multicomponent K+:H+ antiporter subunit G